MIYLCLYVCTYWKRLTVGFIQGENGFKYFEVLPNKLFVQPADIQYFKQVSVN